VLRPEERNYIPHYTGFFGVINTSLAAFLFGVCRVTSFLGDVLRGLRTFFGVYLTGETIIFLGDFFFLTGVMRDFLSDCGVIGFLICFERIYLGTSAASFGTGNAGTKGFRREPF